MVKRTKKSQEETMEETPPNEPLSKVQEMPVARRGIHKAFILYSVLAGLVSLWMAVGQIMGCFVYEIETVSYILRAYVVAACLLLILVELEWTSLARSPLLHNWIGRGLVYTFIGIIGMQENQTATTVREDWDSYQVISDIVRTVAWNMTGCGVVYFLMGIICLQKLLFRMRRDYQTRLLQTSTKDDDDDDDDVDEEAGVEVEYDENAQVEASGEKESNVEILDADKMDGDLEVEKVTPEDKSEKDA